MYIECFSINGNSLATVCIFAQIGLFCLHGSSLSYVYLISQVFGALSQLDCGSEVWERVLSQSLEFLSDSNDEPLAATIDFIFKAASQCQHLPEAVCI